MNSISNTDAISQEDSNQHLRREYWCFISYRHADNKEPGRQWATWLHQALETYEVPTDLVGTRNERGDVIPERIFPVFRDEEELPADAELSKPIEAALQRSRFLVVLCSPQAAQSRFVADEILRFKQLGKQDRILAALIQGEPNASNDQAKGGVEQECFPKPLRFAIDQEGRLTDSPTEPIAADFRLPDGAAGWTSPAACRVAFKALGMGEAAVSAGVKEYTGKQNLMFLKIVAGVLGVPLGVLTKRDKAYQLEKQKQRSKVLRRWLVLVGAIGAVSIVAGLLAFWNGEEATRQRGVAEANAKEATRQRGEAEANAKKAEEQRVEAERNARRAEEQGKIAIAKGEEAEKNGIEAQANAKKAIEEAENTRRSLSVAETLQAESLQANSQRGEALARLARALRSNPANHAAGRRAVLSLILQPWLLPMAHNPPEGLKIHDIIFLDDEHVKLLASKEEEDDEEEMHVGVFDGSGTPLFPGLITFKEEEEVRFENAGSMIEAFLRDTLDTRKKKVTGYWSATTGKPLPLDRRKTSEKAQDPNFLPLPDAHVLEASGSRAHRRDGQIEFTDSLKLKREESTGAGSPIAAHFVDSTRCVCLDPEARWCGVYLFNDDIHLFELVQDVPPVYEDTVESGLQLNRMTSFPAESSDDGSSIVAFSPSGKTFMSNGRLWRVQYRPLLAETSTENSLVHAAQKNAEELSDREKHAITRFGDMQLQQAPDMDSDKPQSARPIKIIDQRNKKSIVLESTDWRVPAQFTPDGTKVIVFADGEISEENWEYESTGVWDAQTGQTLVKWDRDSFGFGGVVYVGNQFAVAMSTDDSGDDYKLLAIPPMQDAPMDFERSHPVNVLPHPDGKRLLTLAASGQLRYWNWRTGSSLSEPVPTLATDILAYSSDASYIICKAQDEAVLLVDAVTLRPFTEPFHAAVEPLENGKLQVLQSWVFGPSREDDLPAAGAVIPIPRTDESVPDWFPKLLEAIGGVELNADNLSVSLSAKQREEDIAFVKAAVQAADARDSYGTLVRWWLDDSPARTAGPLSKTTMADYMVHRITSTDLEMLHQAGLADPSNADIFVRLAAAWNDSIKKLDPEVVYYDYKEEVARTRAKVQWNLDRARRLDPNLKIKALPVPPTQAKTKPKPPSQNPEETMTDQEKSELRQIIEDTLKNDCVKIGRVYVSKTEVTRGEFASFVEQSGYVSSNAGRAATWDKPGFTQQPGEAVVCISYADAQAFCQHFTEMLHLGGYSEKARCRLPTDAEWSTFVGDALYPWGNQWPPPKGAGNFAGKAKTFSSGLAADGFDRVARGSAFSASEKGLFNVAGNVWEWCEDFYRMEMNTAEDIAASPVLQKATETNQYRVLRGGSFTTADPILLRSRVRTPGDPNEADNNNGFRVVIDLGE